MASKIAKTRRTLYQTAEFLGDVRAVQTGRVPQRIARRVGWRLGAKLLRAILPR